MKFSPVSLAQTVGAKELFESGQQCQEHGELDRALAFYARALKLDEVHLGALYWSAVICAQTKNFEDAIVFFERAHALNPGDSKRWGV